MYQLNYQNERAVMLLCIFLVTLVRYIHALSHKYTMLTPGNVKYSDYGEVYEVTSTIECLSFCDGKDNCSSVNFNRGSGRCELTDHLPRILQPDEATDSSWRVYFNDRIVSGIGAWQDSTMVMFRVSMVANFSIDGNRKNSGFMNGMGVFCSQTYNSYSYWAMEFANIAKVDHVVIVFIDRSMYNNRNTNMQLLISMTRDDSDDNVGTTCGIYTGPPADPAVPVKISCVQPVTGKILKINHDFDDLLVLCEVEVYSV